MTQDLFITKLQDLANCYEEEQKRHSEELAAKLEELTEAKKQISSAKADSDSEYLSQLAAKDNELIQTAEKLESVKKQAQAVVKGNQRMRTIFQHWYASRDRVLQQNAELRKQLDSIRADRNMIEKEYEAILHRTTLSNIVPQPLAWLSTTQEPALAAGESDMLILVRKSGTQPIFMSYSPEVRFLFHQYDQWLKIPK